MKSYYQQDQEMKESTIRSLSSRHKAGQERIAELERERDEARRVANRLFALVSGCGLTIQNAPDWLRKEAVEPT